MLKDPRSAGPRSGQPLSRQKPPPLQRREPSPRTLGNIVGYDEDRRNWQSVRLELCQIRFLALLFGLQPGTFVIPHRVTAGVQIERSSAERIRAHKLELEFDIRRSYLLVAHGADLTATLARKTMQWRLRWKHA
jgi:hypothetical protein